MTAGRPPVYSDDIAQKIADGIASGKSLKKTIEQDGMPCMATVFKWISEKPEFTELYDRARAERAELFVEELDELASDESREVARSKLIVDTRKWIVSKMLPKRYGDKVAIGGDDTAPPVSVEINDRTLNNVAFILRKAKEDGII